MEAFVFQAKISEKKQHFYMYSELEARSFLLFRPINRGDDGTLTMFQNRFINMLKAAIQSVSNIECDDSRKELYDQLREETKELRENGEEGPFRRDTGQRSDKVTDRCI